MNKKVMVTLVVLPWLLAIGLSFAVSWGFVHMFKQDVAMHGMARVIIRCGSLAIEQDNRIDGYDAVLPVIFKIDAELTRSLACATNEIRILRDDVEALKSRSVPQLWHNDLMPNYISPTNYPWYWWEQTNYILQTNYPWWEQTNGFSTNMSFYVTPCSDSGIMPR